ncbi:MAG: NADH:ubiquinone oxidoreductase subunit N, partial [Gammaproteobacteria bacterium]|nr:NADH:ubiquinone oxidoreductase subunit N [Gammaproteobacteria bacterium]
MADINVALPEIFLLAMACAVLLAAAFSKDQEQSLVYLLAQTALAGTLVIVAATASAVSDVAFNGTFIADPMSRVLKAFICAVGLFAFVCSREDLRRRARPGGEYYALGLFAVLGMLVLVSAHSLLTVYLGLELLSLSLYSMVALDRDSPSASEAAMKYFVLGAIASGMLLYGMSMIYGVTGTLDLSAIAGASAQSGAARMLL